MITTALDAIEDRGLLHPDALVGGVWQPSEAGQRFKVMNPSSQQVLAQVADCTQDDARAAVDAAAAAFEEWRRCTPDTRAGLLRSVADEMRRNAKDLGLLVTLETGKPIGEGLAEVEVSARWFDWFAEEARRVTGEVLSSSVETARFFTLKQPIGVAALITPWNSPLFSIARKLPPALAAGCTAVLKPSEETPLCALALGELLCRVGLPAGVVNVIPTDQPASVGEELTSNSKVRKVSFTGSTSVGRLLMRQCADSIKRVSLELGGNAPLIVLDDADLDIAVSGAMSSKFGLNGQRCVATNRLFVQAGVYDEFLSRLAERVSALRVGPGEDSRTDIGPVIHPRAAQTINTLVDETLASGARMVYRADTDALGPAFVGPTLVADARPDMRCYSTEIFGPVAIVYKVDSEDEAIRLANDTQYGLAAYVFTTSISRAWRLTERLEHGTVVVNSGGWTTEQVAFGGFKESGIGREGGSAGIDEYLEVKAVRMELS